MVAETEAVAWNRTINYEAASTAVETAVVAAAVDAAASAAAPEAGNNGSLYGSGSGIDVDSGDDDD